MIQSNNVKIPELYKKSLELPYQPGVYLMKNRSGDIIYVGKSRALHARVSQYFSPERYESHSVKTKNMVDRVYDFDIILTTSEIEALALENKLIKLHSPRYNIRLKDDKSYPYIKIYETAGYPAIRVVRTRRKDGGKYYGPYSGMSTAYDIYNTVCRVFALPTCHRVFPRDKVRPCLYAALNQCIAPCKGNLSNDEIKSVFKEAGVFLNGNISRVKGELTEKMNKASDDMMFELAALWRDRIRAIDRLLDKQKVVGAPQTDYDAITISENGGICVAFGRIRDGVLCDCNYIIPQADAIFDSEAMATLICGEYEKYEEMPGRIETDFDFTDEELQFISEYLQTLTDRKIYVNRTVKGDKKRLCDILKENAALYLSRHRSDDEKTTAVLVSLSKAAGLETIPENIESIDISNLGGECVTAGIVCYRNGKKDKSSYRMYNIKTAVNDDYASMREAMERRLSHKDEDPLPDLFLLDGGVGHVGVVRELFSEKGIETPVLGMVKDCHHKTRTLTDGENEIGIAGDDMLFRFIYAIQEEVHRYTISRMKQRKKKKTLKLTLTEIKGIGDKKAASLLKTLGSVKAIKAAKKDELQKAPQIGERDADSIIEYFRNN